MKTASKKQKTPTEAELIAEGTNWEIDRELSLMTSERRAWAVAGCSLIVTLSLTGAIFFMLPLKRVEPYVVRVDNSTGIVDVINTLRSSTSDYSEAVIKYFLVKYVRGRESYAYSQVDTTYNEVMLLSGPREAKQYSAFILPRNPDSPVNKLADKGTIEIKIKSVTFVRSDVANIRYLRIDRKDGAVIRQSNWIATASFAFTKAKAAESVREINPLGFQVTDYRVDPEVITNGELPQVDSTMPVVIPTNAPASSTSGASAPALPAPGIAPAATAEPTPTPAPAASSQ